MLMLFWGVHFIFIDLFLYCWCQTLNYCGLNLFNKQRKIQNDCFYMRMFSGFHEIQLEP